MKVFLANTYLSNYVHNRSCLNSFSCQYISNPYPSASKQAQIEISFYSKNHVSHFIAELLQREVLL